MVSYNNSVPQASQSVAVTQSPILTNFQSIDTAFNGPTGQASGGGNFTTYSMQNTTANYAAKPVNPIGSLYTTSSTNGNPELSWINNVNAAGAGPYTGVQITGGGISAAAWVRFNGSSGAINSSYNVSSVTRNGTGDYTINFTRNFTNTDYICTGSLQSQSVGVIMTLDLDAVPTVSAWRVRTGKLTLGSGSPNTQTYTLTDSPIVCLVFFGTLV